MYKKIKELKSEKDKLSKLIKTLPESVELAGVTAKLKEAEGALNEFKRTIVADTMTMFIDNGLELTENKRKVEGEDFNLFIEFAEKQTFNLEKFKEENKELYEKYLESEIVEKTRVTERKEKDEVQ